MLGPIRASAQEVTYLQMSRLSGKICVGVVAAFAILGVSPAAFTVARQASAGDVAAATSSPPTVTETVVYSFCSQPDHSTGACLDGETPNGLIEGSDGDFYGTTGYGGAHNDGTVFEVGLGHIEGIPTKLTLKAEPNATASASITIENTGTGPVTVDISEPKHEPPFSEVGGGSQTIGGGDDYEVTITYAPTRSTTSKENIDSITVKAISNDPMQKKPITVTLKGEK